MIYDCIFSREVKYQGEQKAQGHEQFQNELEICRKIWRNKYDIQIFYCKIVEWRFWLAYWMHGAIVTVGILDIGPLVTKASLYYW